MTSISVSTARQTLPAQIDRVIDGGEISITRHGVVVAVLVSPETLAHRRAATVSHQADAIGMLLDAARSQSIPEPSIPPSRADELVAEIRQTRIRGAQ